MYQAEALWIDLSWQSALEYPCAIKIATGKINAVTGEAWANGLDPAPQDYLVIPTQRWLDGYAVGQGYIRQFVAMPGRRLRRGTAHRPGEPWRFTDRR